MDVELAKKRIASYMRGNITKEELDVFIDSFGDALAEEVYTAFLLEEFEEFMAADSLNESAPENVETQEPPRPAEEKKHKSAKPGRAMFGCDVSMLKEAVAFLISGFQAFECSFLKPSAASSDHLLILKD